MDFTGSDPDTDFQPLDALDAEGAAREAEALRAGIRHHDWLYYVKNAPAISDTVYDRLFERLQALEARWPDLSTPESPTRKVGAPPLEGLSRARHRAPMLSLRSVREESQVADFIGDLAERLGGAPRLSLEPKFDGLSVELVFEDGAFVRGVTRGDGETGEDITHNLKTLGPLPLRLRGADQAPPARLAVRGEVYLPRDGFTALNRERVQRGGAPFANPRNAAAGLMRQLDPGQVAGRPLTLVCYELLEQTSKDDGGDDDAGAPESHRAVLDALAAWGLPVSGENRTAEGIGEVRDYHARLAERRDRLDYEIDGVVIKLDDRPARERLGVRARSPRWALAWKFAPREEVTNLAEITVQVGRTGILTPVALLDPVDVGGVTVSRATLHNADEVARKDLRPGDRVRVLRAGDVIPEIAERLPTPGRARSDPFEMPDRCPVCDTPVVREGAYHRCPAGIGCSAQLIGHLTHYGSREALDIAGLGEETARQLVDRGLVADLADLYRLTPEHIADLDGFAERSAAKLHDAIANARRPALDRFLYGLGIRHVGSRVARVIADALGSLPAVRDADRARLESIPEVGPEIAGSVRAFFDSPRNLEVLERMGDAGVSVRRARGPAARHLAGTSFVFTGRLEGYTRAEAERAVEDRGGRATGSVSGETDYVVVGSDPGSKAADAEARGVARIDEAEFERLLAGDS